jgi:ATP-dependent DNA ligase
MRAMPADNFVLDGELVIPVDGQLSFDDLLMRLHPAESRVRKLAAQIPATFIAFDLLENESGTSLLDEPLHVRRAELEKFAARNFRGDILLSPWTMDRDVAEQWFKDSGGGLDGVMAKLVDAPYASGERTAMRKFKYLRTAECVVGGFRYGSGAAKAYVASLLLGLYDDDGLLHHVGFTSAMNAETKRKLTPELEKLIEPPGFTGRAPGGPSRWSTERSAEWNPVAPKLVVEIEYDHFSGGRFRHGTSILRWRPDKPPRSCTMDQVERSGGSAMDLVNR